jgi:hypothetical protein
LDGVGDNAYNNNLSMEHRVLALESTDWWSCGMGIPDQSQKKFHRELPALLGFGGLWQILLYQGSILRD